MADESSVPLWVVTILIGAIGTIIVIAVWVLIAHFTEDQRRAERLAVAEAELKRVKEEIGDHTHGIRGWLHQLTNDLTPRSLRRQLEERDK